MPHPISPPEPELHRAARVGDIINMECLIAGGADINALADLEVDNGPHLRRLTPLMVAARSIDGASVQTLRWLLDHGANQRAKSEGGNTAAWYAAGKGGRWGFHEWRQCSDHVDRLRLLLDAGLDPLECSFNGRSLLTEACEAGDPARVQLLLERGAMAVPVSHPTKGECKDNAARRTWKNLFRGKKRGVAAGRLSSYQIPLHCAAQSGSAECVRLILATGAHPDTRDDSGATPLMYAGSAEVVKVLIEAGADINARDKSGHDVLQTILERNDCCAGGCGPERFDVARALVQAGVQINGGGGHCETRLYSAAFTHSYDAMDFLLGIGADPLAATDRSPLHAICWHGEYDDPQTNAAAVRIIDSLIGAGVDVNLRDADGYTPLHEAVEGDWGNVTAVRMLLKHGAEIDAVDGSGQTPLMLAAGRGELECLRALLQAGANPHRKDEHEESAIDCAQAHLSNWITINQEPVDPILLEIENDPEKITQRHCDALEKAKECLSLLTSQQS